MGVAFFIGERHLANCLVTGVIGITFGVFEGAEHPHFDIVADAFHGAAKAASSNRRGRFLNRVAAKKMICRVNPAMKSNQTCQTRPFTEMHFHGVRKFIGTGASNR